MPDHTELRALADAATPGPWIRGSDQSLGGYGIVATRVPASPKGFVSLVLFPAGGWSTRADADLCIAARSAVPELLDEVARLTRELAAMENERGSALYELGASGADSRVEKLAAHYTRLDGHPDVEPGVDQHQEARAHAAWTINDVGAAGLTVIDTTDESTIRTVSRVLWPHNVSDDIRTASDRAARLVLDALRGIPDVTREVNHDDGDS